MDLNNGLIEPADEDNDWAHVAETLKKHVQERAGRLR